MSHPEGAFRGAGPNRSVGDTDDALAPRRNLDELKRLERGLALIRWFAVILGSYLVAETNSGPPPHASHSIIVGGQAIIGVLGLGNAAIVLSTRRARSLLAIRRVGVAAFALDAGVIFALVWTFSYAPTDTTWVILYFLPLEGALRYELPGAVGALPAILASELAREAFLAERFPAYGFVIANVGFRVGTGVIIALFAGLIARSLVREARRLQETAHREAAARQEIATFNKVILAGIDTTDLEESLQFMAEAIGQQLGFHVCAILLLDEGALWVGGLHGLPDSAKERSVLVGEGITGTVAISGRPMLVPDVTKSPTYIEIDPEVRTEFAVPLKIGEEIIGVLDVESRIPSALSGPTLDLLARLADQIALVVHNARLQAEQRATLERLAEREREKHEAETKFRTLVENIPAITYTADVDEASTKFYVSPQVEPLLGVTPAEWEADPREWIRQLHPEDSERVLAETAASRLTGEPFCLEYRLLSRDGRVVWFHDDSVVIRDAEGRPAFVQGVMQDITERKRAQDALDIRLGQQAAVAQLGRSALEGTDVPRLMDEAVALTAQGLDVEYSKALELLPDGKALLLRAGVGWREGYVGHATVATGRGSQPGYTLLSSGPVIVEDYGAETRFGAASLLQEHGVESGMSVVIRGPDRPFGVLGADTSRRRTFTNDDANFIQAIANVLAAAIERRQAEDQLRESYQMLRATDKERRRLLSHLVQAQEEERHRIAADIHDDPIQKMVAVGMRLQMLQAGLIDAEQQADVVKKLHDTVALSIASLRHLLFELRPPILDQEGLVAALHQYMEHPEVGIEFRIENRLIDEPRGETRVILYRIAQETLANVRKHARARRVEVFLGEQDGGFLVRISDDGEGFSPQEAITAVPGHLGLTAMRERAEMAGGWCRVRSIPRGGTTVEFWLPAQAQSRGSGSESEPAGPRSDRLTLIPAAVAPARDP